MVESTSADASLHQRTVVPDNVKSAVKTLLNYCSTFQAESDYVKHLDLENSPERVAKMWRNELLSSYRPQAFEDLKRRFKTFELQAGAPREMIVEVGIDFYSVCAHHMVPFFGTVSVGYIPKDKLVGLSKIPRAVEYFAKQLQLQERFTSQIADFLVDQLEPQAVIVLSTAEHLCMSMRGIRSKGTKTTTSAIRGSATDADVKAEFYRLIGGT